MKEEKQVSGKALGLLESLGGEMQKQDVAVFLSEIERTETTVYVPESMDNYEDGQGRRYISLGEVSLQGVLDELQDAGLIEVTREGPTDLLWELTERGNEHCLGVWLETQKEAYRNGELNKGQMAKLEALPGWQGIDYKEKDEMNESETRLHEFVKDGHFSKWDFEQHMKEVFDDGERLLIYDILFTHQNGIVLFEEITQDKGLLNLSISQLLSLTVLFNRLLLSPEHGKDER